MTNLTLIRPLPDQEDYDESEGEGEHEDEDEEDNELNNSNSTGRAQHEELVGPHPTITKVECVFRIRRDDSYVRNVFRIVKVSGKSWH